jgi:formylglycine-generating enzyme required for sulfatase activity
MGADVNQKHMKNLLTKILLFFVALTKTITYISAGLFFCLGVVYAQERPIEPEMIFVQGGTFTMGFTLVNDNDFDDDELPAHQVTVSDFYIGKYEITQKEWLSVMVYNPSLFKGDNLPVDNVSWGEVQQFIHLLNLATGKEYRLPTEAEWEYAARGGNKSKGYKYSGGDNLDEIAWHGYNSSKKTHPVGQKKPNELGIYDMSGNVCEWCYDGNRVYNIDPQTNPKGPISGSKRVFRGGNWEAGEAGEGEPKYLTVSHRSWRTSGDRWRGRLGFRLALSKSEQ